MTWSFLKFSLVTILLGFLCIWTVYTLLSTQVFTDRQRVVSGTTEVQIRGLRGLASELRGGDEQERQQRWEAIQQDFQSPLEIRPTSELTDLQRRSLNKDGFIYQYSNGMIDFLGVPLEGDRYLRLGPIGNRIGIAVEAEIADWFRESKRRIARSENIDLALKQLSSEYRFGFQFVSEGELPVGAMERIRGGAELAFFPLGQNYYIVGPMKDRSDLLQMGPIPKFKDMADNTVNTAFGLWLVSILVAIGWLVNNLANKFKRIERAAIEISEGRFDTRVNEAGAGESAVLARAFNLMASKTENSIRAKSELLQVVSHELRTPITRLRFAVELLDVSKDETLKRSRMTIIRQSIENLDAIVDEVLEYVRNEEEDPAKLREKIEIKPSLVPMIQVFELEHPKIKTQWRISAKNESLEVYAERIAFNRAVGNLLSNAYRFAQKRVLIHITSDSQNVCIDVEDDGPGIPEDKRVAILAPFVRLAERRIEARESEDGGEEQEEDCSGLGLGLAIVDRILKQHGGSIKIDQGELGGCLARTTWPKQL